MIRVRVLAAAAVFLAGSCDQGVISSGKQMGEPCTDGSECASGTCLPYQGGMVCSASCTGAGDCTNGTECQDLGASGLWCLPGECSPECTDRCCGDDGCGGDCPDICPGQCNTTTCECENECTTPNDTQPCTAYGTCSGTQTCQADLTWSGCDSPGWECTDPGGDETCQVSTCTGTRQCQSDCTWTACANAAWECSSPGTDETCQVGACQGTRQCQSNCTLSACVEDCPVEQSCCPDGCVDLLADASNCGACGRSCIYPDVLDQCYDGGCCFKGCRNGHQELCDDEHFQVPSPYVSMFLVCRTGNGGEAYIASDTGPPCVADNVRRCQCWEDYGQDPRTEIPNYYIAHMTCTADGQVLAVDLSAWEGQWLYVGVHDQPDGSGDMTEVCVAAGP